MIPSTSTMVYLPYSSPAAATALGRYLPSIPAEVATTWLARNLPPVGGQAPWVLDPFGVSPPLVVAMAQAGYRVLVAANNPINRFLLEMAAEAPPEAEFRAALADLAAAYRGGDHGERIEPHIQSLYATECAHCGQTVTAEAFLWERDAAAPYARSYTCPYCGDHGERPATAKDAERAAHFAASGLHRARALERIAPVHDPDRQHAEEALSVYLPRAIYALFTLINRLDGLALSAERSRCLRALLLTACDLGNTLWAHPSGRERPLQLVTPPRFRENNIWLALEQAIPLWTSTTARTQLTCWPAWPAEGGGICLFEGRMKELAGALAPLTVGAVAAALPRPNQAFWTLSALWAGWLWGRQAVGPFVTVLRRRRYDWAWHTTALHTAFSALSPILSPGVPFLGLLGQAEAGLLTAALIAADMAGFNLEGIALRAENSPAQIQWRRPTEPGGEHGNHTRMHRLGMEAACEYLKERGEPATYLPMLAAALTGMAHQHSFRPANPADAAEPVTQNPPGQQFNLVQNALKDILTYRGGFLRFEATEALESGHWWLRQPPEEVTPLADRVEMAIVNYLLQHPCCTLPDIDRQICADFAGLLTPDRELVQVCLESYATLCPESEAPPGSWALRAEDAPAARRAELEHIVAQLGELAQRLGWKAEDLSPVRWVDAEGTTRYWFYPKASAVIGSLLQSGTTPPHLSLIVLPGGRSNLVSYKLHHDPRLAQATQQGWRFLKFRHLRWLLERPQLTPETLEEQLDADPLTYTAPQMRFW